MSLEAYRTQIDKIDDIIIDNLEKRQLISDFERLISSSFMGQAFKVLIIRSENLPPFLGF